MRHMKFAAFAMLLITGQVMAGKHEFIPEAGFVPAEQTAIQIAEAVLTPIYGADAVKSERPFTAILEDGVWIVSGTLHAELGGVAVAEISKKDGRVQRVSHDR